jgi:hypothetical protein
MEIERLPLGQSHADRCRAGTLRWRNAPPGIPPEMAVDFIARLQAGSTIRKLTSGIKKFGPAIVSYERFKNIANCTPSGRQWRGLFQRPTRLKERAMPFGLRRTVEPAFMPWREKTYSSMGRTVGGAASRAGGRAQRACL